MNDRFAREKEQILSQYILHHDVSDAEVGVLAERLDKAVLVADRLHAGQKRKSGEDYIVHPLRTAMEVSRFGRIVDWASVEASILHDTLEDTDYSYADISCDFPDAAKLVQALTKIKDSQEMTYKKLFNYVLKDIRVLLVKLADRLDNLESLNVFSREKQMRIASESVQMYANICRRLCMLDLAERLAEKVGEYLLPDEMAAYRLAQENAKETLAKPLDQLRTKLAEIFPGDLSTRIEIKWNRFNPDAQNPMLPENYYIVRIITENHEDAYRALGRIHMAFNAIPGTFSDTFSNPRTNGYKAIETRVSYRGGITGFYIASRAADRYNRLGLLSMDIDSPQFNLKYLDDLKEFLQGGDGNIQDFMRFQRPDAIQVVTPKGDVLSLEAGTTALDFAFAVHKALGLRATGARINDEPVSLGTELHSGDRVKIEASDVPVCDERHLSWATSRKALSAIKRHLRKVESERAATTGRQWLLQAAANEGIPSAKAEELAARLAQSKSKPVESIYADICLGAIEMGEVLSRAIAPKSLSVGSLVRILRPGRPVGTRKVRRYDFEDPHIRFCSFCVPIIGDEIEGVPDSGRLNVHRRGCQHAHEGTRIPLDWDRTPSADLRDPGPVELEVGVDGSSGSFYSVVWPFKTLELDIQTIGMPNDNSMLRLGFYPGTARTLDKLLRALRKLNQVQSIKLMRGVPPPGQPQSSATSSR